MPTAVPSHNRSSLAHRLRYAARHPQRVVPYLRRHLRDWRLQRRSGGNHIAYYRAVMKSDTARNPLGAVGTPSQERWNALGRMQFDYLVGHGLKPGDHMLEIGCGNLRAGRHFIDYLETGHYYGVDISPDILLAAQQTVVDHDLQDKLPHMTLVDDMRLAHLPGGRFRVVHAHSVFSHSPVHVIEDCFRHVGRLLAPGGFFDFTYNRTDGTEHDVLREDFYFRPATLIALAEKHGLAAHTMDDWDDLPHKQSKIRVTLPAPEEAAGKSGERAQTPDGDGEPSGSPA
ncbi:class I SAM-dependent methyltransferase [Streptomyces sp. DSM 42041]|uniref:Class I SAM-dependent methyltransferase n=1 Tax=Streptomyces hazeniae TaxID=3075538 RepID=A0ABU2NSF7_9ACTN|nr:class I SAM-dependent methyltransferase [Streptomyces sp. DSM 42041]MDT0379914.1 class I SAM-dependent methyltransferase [Streptomyces sp. DSM 42041]